MNLTAHRAWLLGIAVFCSVLVVSSGFAQTAGASKGAGRPGPGVAARSARGSTGKAGVARAAKRSAQARDGKATAKAATRGGGENQANAKQHADAPNTAAPRTKPATTNAGPNAGAAAGASKQVIDSGGAVTSGGTVNRGNSASRGYGRGHGRSRSHRGYHPYSYPPSGTPVLAVDASQARTHVLTFGGRQHRGHGDALPHGVTGVEVWGKVGGPAPTDPNELTRGAVANGNSYTVSFNAGEAGTTAYYAVRYVNSQGTGKFSKIVSAAVKR